MPLGLIRRRTCGAGLFLGREGFDGKTGDFLSDRKRAANFADFSYDQGITGDVHCKAAKERGEGAGVDDDPVAEPMDSGEMDVTDENEAGTGAEDTGQGSGAPGGFAPTPENGERAGGRPCFLDKHEPAGERSLGEIQFGQADRNYGLFDETKTGLEIV
jgi:hypothetical protein